MIDPYAEVKAHFSDVEGVTVGAGTGAQGLKIGAKMFVMFHKGQLLVQFSPNRVTELIESGQGLAHDPGTGKPMKNRVIEESLPVDPDGFPAWPIIIGLALVGIVVGTVVVRRSKSPSA
ncbi:MAG: hypothetical protein HOB82_06255 [Alphaproteobacteria bacterium]|jgi:hypothetical protein|nr:hypothetical protein [Alphaproteobacteria bacterium]